MRGRHAWRARGMGMRGGRLDSHRYCSTRPQALPCLPACRRACGGAQPRASRLLSTCRLAFAGPEPQLCRAAQPALPALAPPRHKPPFPPVHPQARLWGAVLRRAPAASPSPPPNLHSCRHAFGDQYKATDLVIEQPGKLELVFTPEGGEPQTHEVYTFKGGWVFAGPPAGPGVG